MYRTLAFPAQAGKTRLELEAMTLKARTSAF